MDPDVTLAEIRHLLFNEFDLYTLQLKFEALDDWLSAGGFLPEDWSYRSSGCQDK